MSWGKISVFPNSQFPFSFWDLDPIFVCDCPFYRGPTSKLQLGSYITPSLTSLGEGETLGSGTWWHLDPNRSFQNQMEPKLFNLIAKVIIVTPKTFQRFIFFISEIFFEKFERFSLKCSNFVNFWARKMFFFFKQVRISPEIDWYHYQSANAAPNCIVRHRIKTDQFSRSVTWEPTVGGGAPFLGFNVAYIPNLFFFNFNPTLLEIHND